MSEKSEELSVSEKPSPDQARAVKPNRQHSKLWGILLLMSLALNLLVVGFLVAQYWRGDEARKTMTGGFVQLVPRNFIASLPQDRKALVVNILKKYRPSLRAQRGQTLEITDELAQAITQAPYDSQKVKEIIQRYVTESGMIATTGGQATLEILDQLTPAERQALAQSIMARNQHETNHRRDGRYGEH